MDVGAVIGHVGAAVERPVGEEAQVAGVAELLPFRVDPQAGGEELGLEGLRPGAVRQPLLGRLGGEAADEALDGRHGAQTSISNVTGPSLTSATSMCAPKVPRAAPRAAQTRS